MKKKKLLCSCIEDFRKLIKISRLFQDILIAYHTALILKKEFQETVKYSKLMKSLYFQVLSDSYYLYCDLIHSEMAASASEARDSCSGFITSDISVKPVAIFSGLLDSMSIYRIFILYHFNFQSGRFHIIHIIFCLLRDWILSRENKKCRREIIVQFASA